MGGMNKADSAYWDSNYETISYGNCTDTWGKALHRITLKEFLLSLQLYNLSLVQMLLLQQLLQLIILMLQFITLEVIWTLNIINMQI